VSPLPPFELPLEIQPGDIDALDHVNNVVYLRWVQEAAIAHWTAAAPPEAQAALFWVVARHEIDYRRSARLGDRIRAHTWVGAASERRYERHTDILREDGTLLARARTLWCPMDRRTGRPTRVEDSVREAFSTGSELEAE